MSDFDLGHSQNVIVQQQCWTDGRHVGELDERVLDRIVRPRAVAEVLDLAGLGKELHASLSGHGGVDADDRDGPPDFVDLAQRGSGRKDGVWWNTHGFEGGVLKKYVTKMILIQFHKNQHFRNAFIFPLKRIEHNIIEILLYIRLITVVFLYFTLKSKNCERLVKKLKDVLQIQIDLKMSK